MNIMGNDCLSTRLRKEQGVTDETVRKQDSMSIELRYTRKYIRRVESPTFTVDMPCRRGLV